MELAIGANHFFEEVMMLDTSKVQATMTDADFQNNCSAQVPAVEPALARRNAENVALLGMELARDQAFRKHVERPKKVAKGHANPKAKSEATSAPC